MVCAICPPETIVVAMLVHNGEEFLNIMLLGQLQEEWVDDNLVGMSVSLKCTNNMPRVAYIVLASKCQKLQTRRLLIHDKPVSDGWRTDAPTASKAWALEPMVLCNSVWKCPLWIVCIKACDKFIERRMRPDTRSGFLTVADPDFVRQIEWHPVKGTQAI
jgi:hypothetical protein